MLYVICTPIGNLNDFSSRSINTLNSVNKIYAEDTRVAAKLLKHHKINRPTFSFHEHNEEEVSLKIIKLLKAGENIALFSDAGAPLISDPGYPLIQKCIKENISFTVLPGPSAIINAIILSGLPSDKFVFMGFLPKKIEARKKIALKLKKSEITNIFFESSKRIRKTIEIFLEVLGSKTQVSICREMTKEFETIYRGSLDEIQKKINTNKIQLLGEFVLLFHNDLDQVERFDLDEDFCRPFLEYLSPSDASRLIAKISKHPKKEVYKFLLSISK